MVESGAEEKIKFVYRIHSHVIVILSERIFFFLEFLSMPNLVNH